MTADASWCFFPPYGFFGTVGVHFFQEPPFFTTLLDPGCNGSPRRLDDGAVRHRLIFVDLDDLLYPGQRPGLMLRPPIGALDSIRFRGLTMLQQRLRLIAPLPQVCVANLVTLEA